MRARTASWIRRGVQTGMIAIATSAVACRSAPTQGQAWAVAARTTETTVLVRNHYGADLRIWVVAEDGTSHRLSIVPKLGSATVVLPGAVRLPARVFFVAMPMSGDEPQTSSPVTVELGAKLVFTVAHNASLSTLSRLP